MSALYEKMQELLGAVDDEDLREKMSEMLEKIEQEYLGSLDDLWEWERGYRD